jgi:hypothetical protein
MPKHPRAFTWMRETPIALGPTHGSYSVLRARLRLQRLSIRCACVSGIPLSCSSSAAGGLSGCCRTQYHKKMSRSRTLRNPSRTMLPSSLSQRCLLRSDALSTRIQRATIGVPPLLDAFSTLALWSVLPDAPRTLACDTSYACVADSCWMGMHWRGERDGTVSGGVAWTATPQASSCGTRDTTPAAQAD